VACSLTLVVTRGAGSRLKTRKGMSRVVIAVRVVAGVLLLAHGLVHLLYLAPDVPEFSKGRSCSRSLLVGRWPGC
jgi:hypothetical protein